MKECPKTKDSILDCKVPSTISNCSSLGVYASDTVVNLCYPHDIVEEFDIDTFMDISLLQEYFADLKDGWPLILAIFGVSFFISLFFMLFIRFCAGCFVWSFILIFILLQILIGTFFFLIN